MPEVREENFAQIYAMDNTSLQDIYMIGKFQI